MKKYKKIYKINYINNKEIKETIEKRYNILIFIIIAIMLVLLVNLLVVQVFKHNFYVNKIEMLKNSYVTSKSAPRGRIYDRNGVLIVDNEPVKVIFYKKKNNVTTKEEIEMAIKVADLIDIDYKNVVEDDLRTFWVKQNKEEASLKITEEEWELVSMRKLTLDDIYNLKKERVSEEELKTVSSKAAYIYKLMNQGYSYDEKVIKKTDVTDKEYATIASNINVLEGFDVRLDWVRTYPYGNTFRTILGNVSTDETGIPYELKDYYLNLGYELNDRVGTSYLEYQYESVLKGEKSVYQLVNGEKRLIKEGSRGNDIMLTIDIKLQKEIESILEEELLTAMSEPNTRYLNKAYAIISDPKTGEILAMAGKEIVKKDGKYVFYDYTPGIITSPVVVGSVVKGASNIVGYNTGNLEIGEKRDDKCIKIAATPLKCSWTSLGTMDDVLALRYSSNVFQFKTAIKVGGGVYEYNKPLNINKEAFEIYRKTFAEFGLGVKTGIDLPVESLGYKGTSKLAGHLLDFAIGQYDTYTPIQLMQYINTVANDGNRTKPYLLKAIYKPTKDGLTDVLSVTKPTILNKVNTEDKYLDRVREGFKMVLEPGGTGYGYLDNSIKPAGKTGTAQGFIDTDNDGVVDKETLTNTFAGYAPYDEPKVSFVVVTPDIYYNEGTTTRTKIIKRISTRISKKYFELYE